MRSKEGKSSASRIVCKGLDVTHVNSAGEAVSSYRLELLREIVTVPYRGKNLRIVAFSDWRVQEIAALIRFLRAQKKPDLVFYEQVVVFSTRKITSNTSRSSEITAPGPNL